MLPCRLRYVAVSWPWCVASLYMLFLDSLAHGCPTRTGLWFVGTWLPNTFYGSLRSGTWLPNFTVRHTVAQHSDLVSGQHMGAYHVFRSTRLYISFDLHQRASYWLWYYATSTIIRWFHVMYYGHSLLRLHAPAELCTYVFHEHCYYGHQFIGTPVHPAFSTFHVYSMTLQYYHASSSWRFTVFSVLPRCVEPFLVGWLSGYYVML